ncbi:ATP-binding cassette domain-containing protein [Neisseria iguanae]|uniref:ATP-binding cassette domain-containing protein n=1 Tax=Neisseria iguanae TaxID=90242 RepID=UPI00267D692B
MVSQELAVDAFLTVREALRFQSGYFGIKNNDVWTDGVINSLSLSDKANTITRNLSGGMERRVMITQVLVHRTSVIVLTSRPPALMSNCVKACGHLSKASTAKGIIAMMKQGCLMALDSAGNLLHA